MTLTHNKTSRTGGIEFTFRIKQTILLVREVINSKQLGKIKVTSPPILQYNQQGVIHWPNF